jgi:hypothetical protein
MVINAQLPNFLWSEVVNMTIYFTNQNPTSVNGSLTPIHFSTSQPPKLNHLKMFGCLAYIHVIKLIGGKMEPRFTKNLFVGYDNMSQAYHVYNPHTCQIVISKDVVCNEEVMQQWF